MDISNTGDHSVVQNATSISRSQVNVSLFTPTSVPGVFDNPLGLVISDKQNSVVYIIRVTRAIIGTVHSGGVVEPIGGINTN